MSFKIIWVQLQAVNESVNDGVYPLRSGITSHDVHPYEISLLPVPYILPLRILSSLRLEIVQEHCQRPHVLPLHIFLPTVFWVDIPINIEVLEEVQGFQEADGADEGIYFDLKWRIALLDYGRSKVHNLPEVGGMQDHVLHSQIQNLINLSLISEEVEIPPVQVPREEYVILLFRGLLNEFLIGNTS